MPQEVTCYLSDEAYALWAAQTGARPATSASRLVSTILPQRKADHDAAVKRLQQWAGAESRVRQVVQCAVSALAAERAPYGAVTEIEPHFPEALARDAATVARDVQIGAAWAMHWRDAPEAPPEVIHERDAAIFEALPGTVEDIHQALAGEAWYGGKAPSLSTVLTRLRTAKKRGLVSLRRGGANPYMLTPTGQRALDHHDARLGPQDSQTEAT